MQRIRPLHRTGLLALPLLLVLASGCKKEFDTPPVRTIPGGSVVTIAQLKALYFNQLTPVHFSDTAGAVNTVYGVVTADEQNGNLYKNLYIQDHTGAIAIRLLSSGGLYQGDSIRIYLPGTVLSPYNGLMQIDSVDVDNNVVKQATGVSITPRPTLISELTNANFGLGGPYQSMLVKISGVQFAASDTGLTYADPVTQQTLNRTLEDCNGDTTIVRNSGYANFAGQNLPNGKGVFTGIASWFGNAAQLYIRNINEVQLNGPRCGESTCDPVATLNEDFSTVTNNIPVTLECWTNTFTEGSVAWRGKVADTDRSAEARISLGQASTMWLITPEIAFNGTQQLSFSSAWHEGAPSVGWKHDGVTVWVSTDYSGNVTAATWTQVTGASIAGQADADGAWVNSGPVTLASFLPSGYSGNFVIAFKYQGDAANSTTYRVDNVQVN